MSTAINVSQVDDDAYRKQPPALNISQASANSGLNKSGKN